MAEEQLWIKETSTVKKPEPVSSPQGNLLTESSEDSIELLRLALKNSQLEVANAVSMVATNEKQVAEQHSRVLELQEELSHAEQTIIVQRNKIQSLLMENERIGAEREILASLERRLQHISPNPHAALAELLAWQQLGMNRLAPSLDIANAQADTLWNYVREMNSPGHRMVSFIGKLMSSTWLGRKLRSIMHYFYILLKV